MKKLGPKKNPMVSSTKGGFSMIITGRTLLQTAILVCLVILAVTAPNLRVWVTRQLYGVKPGVTLEGYPVGGLLADELYEAVASLAAVNSVEARNAEWDWQTSQVLPEQVGTVIDIKSTVEQLLQASSGSQGEFVRLAVLPSITQANFKPIYRGPVDEPRMSLMVNVDWGDEFIPSMLETFARYNVVTTWFPTGRWVSRTPELAKQISDAGHEMGNHGGWHGMASQMGADETRRLILEGAQKIEEVTGQKSTIFAPPAGDMNNRTVAIAGELGYKTVLWTIDTVDWQRPAATVIVDRVVGKAQNGALVLMHPTKPTAEALPIIIERLKEKGYKLVTVSELLAD